MGNPTILVVDDDDDVRTMLCTVLDAEGYTAEGAADGLEALQRMHRGVPALIVLDLMMPRMSGEDLIAAMTSDRALVGIPIIVLSGQQADRPPWISSRVMARLVKPVELDEFLGVIHRFVH